MKAKGCVARNGVASRRADRPGGVQFLAMPASRPVGGGGWLVFRAFFGCFSLVAFAAIRWPWPAPAGCRNWTGCRSTRRSGIGLSRSMPDSSRWWRSGMCPKPKFGLPKCRPDSGHWTLGMLLTGLTAEIRKAALQFASPNHIADIGGGKVWDRTAAVAAGQAGCARSALTPLPTELTS